MKTVKIIGVFTLTIILSLNGYSQDKYKLNKGEVSFFSYAPLENIEAFNKKPAGLIDIHSKKFIFKINIRDFIFKSSLMQEHFNENYMETEKYPYSSFKGNIIGDINLAKDGEYRVISKGELTIHGITKVVEIPSLITVKGSEIRLLSEFKIRLEDYKVEVPTIVIEKIAEVVDVKIISSLTLLEKK